MFLDLPRDVIRSVAHFKLCVRTLRFETATWNSTSFSNCDLCEADDDVQDEKTCSRLLHAPSDDFSPQKVRVLTFTDRIRGCVCFLTPGNNKLHLFLLELILQASSHSTS